MQEPTAERCVLLVTHTRREAAVEAARQLIDDLTGHGIAVRLPPDEWAKQVATEIAAHVCDDLDRVAQGCELVVVVGGDGTILRGAEMAYPFGIPVLGINLGHVGFLAEADLHELSTIAARVQARDYTVEERMCLRGVATVDGQERFSTFAVNEIALEKAARERMLTVMVEVDGHPLSRWGCDGLVCATPTGSTAHAFSGGGPVVWPNVSAFLLVPLSAHALFARPLVVAPTSEIVIDILPDSEGAAVLWADGRRTTEVPRGARVRIARAERPLGLARLNEASFTSRLVAKFNLPVMGWRHGAD